MYEIIQAYFCLSLVVLAYMTGWFFLALLKKRNDVADIAWGLGFFLIAVLTFYNTGPAIDRGLIATLLVAIWATRLSVHIYLRNRIKKEDYRYKAWREQWGKWFYLRTFFQVFVLQGFFMLLIVSPVVIINIYRGNALNIIDLLGIGIWTLGFYFEAVGDWQLSRFIKNPVNKGKIMQAGLWKYTRHPNYFGEVTQWWGVWIIALSVPYGWIGIIGPLTITFLILKVSGIPLLEKNMSNNPLFQEYKKKTSIFFPLPPKK